MVRFAIALMALFALPAQAQNAPLSLEAGMLSAREGSAPEALTLVSTGSSVGGDSLNCLAEALYFEARGEGEKGQIAVAEVILNRVDSPRFPNSVCGVVRQGTGRKFACQFSFTCDGRPETIHEPRAYRKVKQIAQRMLSGAPRKLTQGAMYFHTKSIRPSWSRKFTRTATIGVHRFYRP